MAVASFHVWRQQQMSLRNFIDLLRITLVQRPIIMSTNETYVLEFSVRNSNTRISSFHCCINSQWNDRKNEQQDYNSQDDKTDCRNVRAEVAEVFAEELLEAAHG
jgi:translation elongation factor EF-1alpha